MALWMESKRFNSFKIRMAKVAGDCSGDDSMMRKIGIGIIMALRNEVVSISRSLFSRSDVVEIFCRIFHLGITWE